MKPTILILTVVLCLSLPPGLLGAPYDSAEVQALSFCADRPCHILCRDIGGGLPKCTQEAIAQDTYTVARRQDICEIFPCTPLLCGPSLPEMCQQVEEQRKDNADKLGPLKQRLLRWLKTKLTYHINLSDDDQDDPIISKDSFQEKLLEQLLSKRKSPAAEE